MEWIPTEGFEDEEEPKGGRPEGLEGRTEGDL